MSAEVGAPDNEGNKAPVRVLIADDEPEILRVYELVLRPEGYVVQTAPDGQTAVELFKEGTYDVVLADLTMPGLDGVGLLRAIREIDLDVPVVIITAAPSMDSAIRAVEYGALRYLLKPIRHEELLKVVRDAVRLHKIAKLKREALILLGNSTQSIGDQVGLEVTFERALQEIFIAFQPIVQWSTRRVFGFEALVRSKEPKLPHPGLLFDAAERLDRVHELGRAIRGAAASPFSAASEDQQLFINLHIQDLDDDRLLDPSSLLAQCASRVILEITERASLHKVRDLRARVAALRDLGFRLAVDDLGAGYAGLSSFSLLEPEVVKIDMSLVRDVHKMPTKQKLIRTFLGLCEEMGIEMVVEGVETPEERDALVDIGCDLLQGFLFAQPGPPFPDVNW